MSTLPSGWRSTSVSDLIAPDGIFSDGDWVESKDQDPNGSIRLLQLADIGDGVFIDKSHRFINEEKFRLLRCTEVLEGDVLIARMPDPLGRACLAPKLKQKSVTVVDVAILRTGKHSAHPVWLMHFLNSPAIRQGIELESSGTTRKRIARGKLAKMKLPVPPLAEQKRIASKLEAVLGRVDVCLTRLDRIPALLKRFRQSVLAAATSGQLTEDWREENGTNDEWLNMQVQDIAHEVFDGPFGSHLKTNDYTTAGIRVVRLENIGWLKFFAEKETFISPEKYQTLKRHTLKKGDVIFSSFISEDVRVCLLPEAWSGKAINKSDCFCVRADTKKCTPEFLTLRLACRSTFIALAEGVHGATRPRINLGQLKEYSFALPPLPEQQEIVRRVEALFAFTDRIEAQLTKARTKMERLTPSILAKAFRGELVPQDPTDEPAAAMLARIRAPREALETHDYMVQFIPALLHAAGGALPFDRTVEGCALLLQPQVLIRLLKSLGEVDAQRHFEKFVQPVDSDCFLPILQQLIAAGVITHDDRDPEATLRLVEDEAPPISESVFADARYLSQILALVPSEVLATNLPPKTRKVCKQLTADVFLESPPRRHGRRNRTVLASSGL